jgi:hypothetical protein
MPDPKAAPEPHVAVNVVNLLTPEALNALFKPQLQDNRPNTVT